MPYIMNMTPDRFSLDYIIQENHQDKNTTLVSSTFLNSLTEEQKMSLADMMGGSAMKNSEKKLAHLTKKGTFLDLPKTKGDIKKSKSYKTTKQCISMLKPIIEKAKGKNTVEAVTAFQNVEASMGNLEKNVKYFERAYQTNDSANILAYQTIAAATIEFASIILINSTAFTEANTLIYRDPPKNSLTKNILFKNLEKFNDICRNNKLKLNEDFEAKCEEYEMVHHEAVGIGATLGGIGSAIGGLAASNTPAAIALGVLAVGSSILALVYLSRTLICYYYFKKIEISENLKYISGMVEANSLAVGNGNPRDKSISQKQSGLASKLKKLGEALDNDNKQAQHNSIATLKKEDSKVSKGIEAKINPDNRQEVTPRDGIDNLGDDLFI